ncbi:MAG TPA: hypothetical protein VFR55_14575, partial [Dehalococcoidia bacterium]|nr:hypothetical protein [Dehalococcoidia bacterium]
DGACLNVLGVRGMDFSPYSIEINNHGGTTVIDGVSSAGAAAPVGLIQVLTRLVGSNQETCTLQNRITSLTDDGGNSIGVVPPEVVQSLLRGDALADGNVTIADALFIAQYLAGSRPACPEVVDTTCLHSVNAAGVRQDGAFDQKTIADALFIAQYLVGLRDEFYHLTP